MSDFGKEQREDGEGEMRGDERGMDERRGKADGRKKENVKGKRQDIDSQGYVMM